MATVSLEPGRVYHGDCIELMDAFPAGKVDLVFADPPFNIGYDYDVYQDNKDSNEYLEWSKRWIQAVYRVLKPTGTFWLAIGDEYAAELKVLSQQIGFTCRSWVVWYYTFGVNCKAKFTRSHAHLFYFVKDRSRFTFRGEELENRVPSARQLVYADARANPRGRLPDDTWVLRPQDLSDCFTAAEDTWYFPRVAGTFKERAGFHGCQMPEQLLGRIIRSCSETGELVLDPFSGSATTVAVAKKLGRQCLGFDLSPEYVTRGNVRLREINVGDALDGAAEPTMSAPATPRDGSKKGKVVANQGTPLFAPIEESAEARDRRLAILREGLLAAYAETNGGYSLDRLVADPELNNRFLDSCRRRGLPGDPRSWNRSLFRLRKVGALSEYPTEIRTELSWSECEPFLFASEIALRKMRDQGFDSLDEMLCDPDQAARFDALASELAPGFSSLQYRWGALKLRKEAKVARTRGESLEQPELLDHPLPLGPTTWERVPEIAAVYLVSVAGDSTPLYVGGSLNLRNRLRSQFSAPQWHAWESVAGPLEVQYFSAEPRVTDLIGYQSQLVTRHHPRLNPHDLSVA